MKQLLYRITEPAGSIPDERKIFSNHALKLLILPLFFEQLLEVLLGVSDTFMLFGAGQLTHLHEQTMPGKKAMVVISNGKSTRENGSLDRTLNELHQAGVETVLFDKVGANPLKSVVEEGGRFAKDNGCDYEKSYR